MMPVGRGRPSALAEACCPEARKTAAAEQLRLWDANRLVRKVTTLGKAVSPARHQTG